MSSCWILLDALYVIPASVLEVFWCRFQRFCLRASASHYRCFISSYPTHQIKSASTLSNPDFSPSGISFSSSLSPHPFPPPHHLLSSYPPFAQPSIAQLRLYIQCLFITEVHPSFITSQLPCALSSLFTLSQQQRACLCFSLLSLSINAFCRIVFLFVFLSVGFLFLSKLSVPLFFSSFSLSLRVICDNDGGKKETTSSSAVYKLNLGHINYEARRVAVFGSFPSELLLIPLNLSCHQQLFPGILAKAEYNLCLFLSSLCPSLTVFISRVHATL